MPNYNQGNQNISEWHKDIVKSAPALPAASAALSGFRRYHSGRNIEYYCDNSTFLGLPAAWYRVGVGDNDDFTRANSTTDIGNTLGNSAWWQAKNGTGGVFGITSNLAYVATGETADDVAFVPLGTNNPTVQCTVIGTLNSGVNYRGPGLAFRALDQNNFLWVDLQAGLVRLQKRDAGTNTSLTTTAAATTDNVTYTLTVVCKGRFVSVYVDGVIKITNFDLTLANGKYLNYTWGGFRLGLAGAPATAARWGNFVARQAA